jgi:hypothetical protein
MQENKGEPWSKKEKVKNLILPKKFHFFLVNFLNQN